MWDPAKPGNCYFNLAVNGRDEWFPVENPEADMAETIASLLRLTAKAVDATVIA